MKPAPTPLTGPRHNTPLALTNERKTLCDTSCSTPHTVCVHARRRGTTHNFPLSNSRAMRVSGNSGVVVLPRGRPSSLPPTRQHPHQTPERRCPLARHARKLWVRWARAHSGARAHASSHHTSHHSCQSVVRNSRIFSRLSPNISCACRARARGKPIAISCFTWLRLGLGLGLG